jgi:hypothetical protein
MISSAFFATASAFAPKANTAFRHAGARAFSRSSVAMMAGNPKGRLLAGLTRFGDVLIGSRISKV